MTYPVKEEWMVWKVQNGGPYLFFLDRLATYQDSPQVELGGYVVTTPHSKWLVRFSSRVKNQGVFHTDLNGFNFEMHYFRKDLPIQNQVLPMPTLASKEDKHMRRTVLSKHAEGTAFLEDGAIDVGWIGGSSKMMSVVSFKVSWTMFRHVQDSVSCSSRRGTIPKANLTLLHCVVACGRNSTILLKCLENCVTRLQKRQNCTLAKLAQ
jgi:hypothetical protein